MECKGIIREYKGFEEISKYFKQKFEIYDFCVVRRIAFF